MKPLLFHLSSSGLDLSPDLVEYVKVGFHLLGEKVELAVTFPGWTDELVLLQSSDVMLRDSVVDVKSLGELVDIARLVTENIEDLATVGSAAGPSENIPQETFPRCIGRRMDLRQFRNTWSILQSTSTMH